MFISMMSTSVVPRILSASSICRSVVTGLLSPPRSMNDISEIGSCEFSRVLRELDGDSGTFFNLLSDAPGFNRQLSAASKTLAYSIGCAIINIIDMVSGRIRYKIIVISAQPPVRAPL